MSLSRLVWETFIEFLVFIMFSKLKYFHGLSKNFRSVIVFYFIFKKTAESCHSLGNTWKIKIIQNVSTKHKVKNHTKSLNNKQDILKTQPSRIVHMAQKTSNHSSRNLIEQTVSTLA